MSGTDPSIAPLDELHRMVLDSHFDGVVMIVDQRIVYANPAMTALTGFDAQLIGMSPAQLVVEADRERASQRVRDLLDGSGEHPSTYTLIRADGSEFFAEIRSRKIVCDGVSALLSFVRDLTEQHDAQQALRESEARQRLMLSQIPAILWTTDSELRFSSSLGAGLEGIDLKPNSVVGSTLYEFFETDDPDFLPIAMHRDALAGELKTFDMNWQDHVYQCHVEPFVDECGRTIGTIGAAHDVTEQRQAELARQETDQRFRQLVENINEVFFIVSGDWSQAPYISPAFMSIWGDERRTYRRWPLRILKTIHPDDRETLTTHLRRGVAAAPGDASSGQRMELEFRIICADDRVRWIHSKISLIFSGGVLDRIEGTAAEVTQLRQAEQALRLTEFAVDVAAEAMFTVAPDGRILNANQVACERLEYSRDELLAMRIMDIDPNYPAERWPTHWQELRQQRVTFLETQHRTKTGRILDVEVSVAYFEFEGIEYCCSSIRDITKRKRAEEQLKLTQFSVDRCSVGVFWIDAAGGFQLVNNAACQMLGYDQANLLSMAMPDIDPDMDAADWQAQWKMLKEDGTHRLVSHLRTKGGTVFPVEINASFLEYGDREFNLSFVQDVTQSKRSTDLLRLQHQVLEGIASGQKVDLTLDALCEIVTDVLPAARAVVFRVSPDGSHLNRVACRGFTEEVQEAIAGLPVERGYGTCVAATLSGQHSIAADVATDPNWSVARDTVLGFGIQSSWSYPILLEGKVYGTFAITFEESRQPTDFHHQLLETAANLAGIAVQRGRDEEELRFTQFSVDHSLTEIYWIHPDASFFYVNPAACKSLGYTREELLSMSVMDIAPTMHADDWPTWWNNAKERKVLKIDTKHRRKDGSIFPTMVMLNFMKYQQREYFVAFVQDMSEKKRTEEKLQQHRNELAHFSRLSTMGEMATGIAHELNQPLTAIANLAYATEKHIRSRTDAAGDSAMNIDGEAMMDAAVKLREQSVRAGDIVRRLRSFVKKTVPQRSEADLRDIVRDALQLLEPDLREEQVRVALQEAENLPAIFGDAIQIQQVLVNLIRNSIDAFSLIPRGERRIWVTLRGLESHLVEVEVRDNGRGFEQQDLRSIFEGFYSTKEQGMGMGLAISRTIVEAHSGRLIAEHGPERGALFRVRLPGVEADHE